VTEDVEDMSRIHEEASGPEVQSSIMIIPHGTQELNYFLKKRVIETVSTETQMEDPNHGPDPVHPLLEKDKSRILIPYGIISSTQFPRPINPCERLEEREWISSTRIKNYSLPKSRIHKLRPWILSHHQSLWLTELGPVRPHEIERWSYSRRKWDEQGLWNYFRRKQWWVGGVYWREYKMKKEADGNYSLKKSGEEVVVIDVKQKTIFDPSSYR
jgi:hypothetical protein